MVYVLDHTGNPLMPTQRHGWVRRALRDGRARVVQSNPFAIQLNYPSEQHTQPITLGIDTGFSEVGYAAVAAHGELLGGVLTLLQGVSERLEERSAYRSQRRARLRYRKPGFARDTKHKGWLAPSLQHKLDAHVRLIQQVKALLPVTDTVIEVAAFDTHKLKNPQVAGTGYQHGEQFGYDNLREYVFHRDGHRCQNPDCPHKQPILQVHHIGYWRQDRSHRPGNLITLCIDCHRPEHHQKGGFLYGWQPVLKTLRAATFMSQVRWQLLARTGARATFGYRTKALRRQIGLEKSHHNDAFVIAGGTTQPRCETRLGQQRRRNNRSLETFYDARYRDCRDGKTKAGKVLCSARRTRSRENLPGSQRQFRGHRVKPGRRSIRTRRYPLQPGDRVRLDKHVLTVKGTHCSGARAILAETGKSVAVTKLTLVSYGKGIQLN